MAVPLFLTLDEMLKTASLAGRTSNVQMFQIFRESVFLDSRTFKNIGGASDDYAVEASLPPTQKRGLNEPFTDTGGGRTGLEHENLRIYGLRLREDEAARIMGITSPSQQNELATKSTRLALEFDAVFGDPDVDPKSIAGTQYWAENSGDTAATSISAGTTVGGAALSVFQLREAIDECLDPGELLMGSTMLNRLTGGAENVGVSGTITYTVDDFGRRIAMFDGLPIRTMEKDSSQARILAFTEVDQPAGGSNDTASSIYVLGSGYYWFQNGGPDIMELPQDNVQVPRRLHWLVANAAVRYSVVRLKHIGNLPVVA